MEVSHLPRLGDRVTESIVVLCREVAACKRSWPTDSERSPCNTDDTLLTKRRLRIPVAWKVTRIFCVCALLDANAAASGPSEKGDENLADESDDFDYWGAASTHLQVFQQRQVMWPGLAPEVVTVAPVNQSLSAHASRIDSPFGVDSAGVSFAAWGQLSPGAPEGTPTADWDLPTAFVTQRIGLFDMTLGRQVAAGGAARYSRMDGARLRASLPFGASVSGYAGWTALPRWDGRYGYHRLEGAYDDWVKDPEFYPEPQRSQYAMGGALLDFRSERGDLLGFSFHHESERGVSDDRLAFSGSLSRIEEVELSTQLLYSINNERFSDLRLGGHWDFLTGDPGEPSATLHARVLHTVPALMLSPTSVFSVFAFQELTEWGGEVSGRLPLGLDLDVGGYGQVYAEGDNGYRAQLKARFNWPEQKHVFRLVMSRLGAQENGYWMVRAAAQTRFVQVLEATLDVYQYFYDEQINGYSSSSHFASYLSYKPEKPYWATVGGTVATTPLAAADARFLASFTYEYAGGGR